ncbi:hypothetical protein P171DRAFT_491713 [Karstenula rhodostoma CBS 690.94]|uniref:Cytochrome b561 domain-containing protein n=1 Tax=Karstenula rhodostoma CBS 690.94 TaxID=1392251 RepID=A0A9P4U4E3_9PLEO|nr:hypothetical protein P171DRAFT_491713 [Karstenula rhodostoma CBS 690.94]
MARVLIAAAVAAFAATAFAAVSTRCPLLDVCFRVESFDATRAVAGCDFLLGISAPATYNITLAHHNRERGQDDLFHVFANAGMSDLVTSRVVVGREIDNHDKACERLPSSGVKDGKMAADIRCSLCDAKSSGSMDLSTPVQSWNWTYSVTDVAGHVLDSGAVSFDSPTPPLLTQLKSRQAPAAGRAGGFKIPARTIHMAMAHGVLACTAWALVFPLGGILVRLCSFRNLVWVHTGLQIFGLCLYTAAVGLGVNLGLSPWHRWIKDKHAIIGLTVYGLFLTQAASGYIHHIMFKKYISRTTWSHIHLWTGRLCITLAMVNAGFGFQLRQQKIGSWKVVLYTVCAGLMWCAYVASIVVGEWRRNKQMKKAASSLETRPSPADSGVHMPMVREIPKQS